MNVESARRVMETTCPDTANQYLRFGWKLINQHVVEATADAPATVKYVLASVRHLDDTRQVIVLTDPLDVNQHLELGWKLINQYVTGSSAPEHRHETLHFILAWQSDEPAHRPGSPRPPAGQLDDTVGVDEELI